MRFKNILKFTPNAEEKNFKLHDNNKNIKYDYRVEEKDNKKLKVSGDYNENLNIIKERFSYPENNDVVIRELKIRNIVKAFIVFYDGMSDGDMIDLAIIKALQEIPLFGDTKITTEAVLQSFVSHSQATVSEEIDEIIEEINFGSCGLFIEGLKEAFFLDVRKWGARGIEKPENEQSIYGPQEAFGEMLRNNSALVRKIIKNEKLICKGIKVGKISKTRGVLMYISDIANNELVEEAQRRLEGIDIDYIIAVEEVSLLIEEKSLMITNHILETERPDRVARALSEGRVVFILNGSPKALVLPTNAFELIGAASDDYLRFPYANMARLIRITAMFISILLPALYISITMFHQEMVPTFLIFSISAARENVPFPSVIELLLMDFSFELIREAGIRMPGMIGSTLGIVGGLILGQAAVSAKIVSPIMIIIIAITGIGSFAISDYSLEWSYRILRIVFIILAAMLGFYGVALGIFLYAVFLGAETSFGVPFLSPLSNGKTGGVKDNIFMSPIWKREKRPEFLKTKRNKKEPKISERWRIKKNEG